MKIPQSVRQVIASGALAHMVTLNPDGSPQVTLVWIGLEGDEIVSGHLGEHRKVRNIRNNSQVAISLETNTKNPIGMTQYVVLYGEAYIQEGGAPELLQRLAETYIGPSVKFPPGDNNPAGYVTHIRVKRITGVGPWTE
jgi:PPOX class probable F420-dependent enzyme